MLAWEARAGDDAQRTREGALGQAGACRGRQRALEHADPPAQGIALGLGRGQLGHEAVALGPQGLGVGAAAVARRA